MAQKATRLLPAYLIMGNDQLKRERAVTRLKARLDEAMAVFNLDERTAGPDLDPADLRSSLETLPMGPGFRLVIVHDADKLAKAVQDELVDYLARPNELCTLALVCQKLAKNTRLYKAVAKIDKQAVLDFSTGKKWDLVDEVAGKIAARHGIRVDRDAAEELVERVGESTTMLDNQVATLAELCRVQGRVTRSDVETNVARIVEVKPWPLLDACSARDVRRALELYQLMQNPSQVQLVSLLEGRLRELVCASSLAARGKSGALAGELGRQAWQVKNHARWARGWTEHELVAALDACATCERELKSGYDEDVSFTRLLVILGR